MNIRPIEDKDSEKVFLLFQKVFNKTPNTEYYNWKYKEVFYDPLILVWEENNCILGHVALWIMPAYIQGKEGKIALRVDTMVDPDARGKGIYHSLNQEILKKAKEKNISFLYGFPADKAKEMLLKHTRAIHVDDISRQILFTPFLIKRKKLSLNKYIEIKKISNFDQDFDELSSKIKNNNHIEVKRNSIYLNWRFNEHPLNKYTTFALYTDNVLSGYVVIKKEIKKIKGLSVKIGSIVDILYMAEEVQDILLEEAKKQLKFCFFIQTWVLPSSSYFQGLKRAGFQEKDRPMPLVVHNLNKFEQEINHNNWYITQADVDSF